MIEKLGMSTDNVTVIFKECVILSKWKAQFSGNPSLCNVNCITLCVGRPWASL